MTATVGLRSSRGSTSSPTRTHDGAPRATGLAAAMSSEAGGERGWRAGPLLLALSVGLVLSDSSVVTLALPSILREFDATVSEVAWVLIAFNLALAEIGRAAC